MRLRVLVTGTLSFWITLAALAYPSLTSISTGGPELTSLTAPTSVDDASRPVLVTPLPPTPTVIVRTIPQPTLVPMVPYTLQVQASELLSPRFVGTDTVAYLQWGNFYIYNLAAGMARSILTGGDVTDFDWSAKRGQFVVVKSGQLLLLDGTGRQVSHLSDHLTARFPPVEIPACDLQGRHNESSTRRINVTRHVKEASWSPEQDYLHFSSDLYDEDSPCFSIVWLYEPGRDRLAEIGKVSWGFTRRWLNSDLLMVDNYGGGGSYMYDIYGAHDAALRLTVRTEVEVPASSRDGRRIASLSAPYTLLEIWDTTTGQEIMREALPVQSRLVGEAWSSSGRYLALAQAVEPPAPPDYYTPSQPRLKIMDLDTRQDWQPAREFGQDFFWGAWLPDRDRLLLFSPETSGTAVFLVDPANRSVLPLGEVGEKHLFTQAWSSTGRYLLLTGSNALWVWDRQRGSLPYPVHQVNAPDGQVIFDKFVWSPNDEWLVFAQTIGQPYDGIRSNPYLSDITLQAFHLPTGHYRQVARWAAPAEN